MERMCISPKLIRLVKDLYRAPRFKVVLRGNESEFYPQSSGIRQGCPLPPVSYTHLRAHETRRHL
eukprot:6837268-Prorocentrum_lima.AAC.1